MADHDFRSGAVDAGEISARHSATALYAVTYRPNASYRVATLFVNQEEETTWSLHWRLRAKVSHLNRAHDDEKAVP